MVFEKKIIPKKRLLAIDVWTHKIKVALFEYKNNKVEIVEYIEKRQEKNDTSFWEVKNIKWVVDTIKKALKGINDTDNIGEIIINIPSQYTVSQYQKISTTRSNPKSDITYDELRDIILSSSNITISQSKEVAQNKLWLVLNDIKLISSTIWIMQVDGKKISNPIWKIGRDINISILNTFIPKSRYHNIKTLWKYLEKDIISIVPDEISIVKLLSNSNKNHDDIIYINIWNENISITLQKWWDILGFSKINLWISDLIKQIKQKDAKTTIDIMKKIRDKTWYLDEKERFLEVFEEVFIVWLKDILNTPVIPYRIFLYGWWVFDFIKDFIKNIDLSKYNLHKTKDFEFIDIFPEDLNKNISLKNLYKFNWENYWLLSMILYHTDLTSKKTNPLVDIIQDFIKKIRL